jgi:hypothetical protein
MYQVGMKQLKASIISATEVVNGVYYFRLEAPEIAAAAKPGQFVMVRCGGETILPRPFSIHAAGDNQISLLIGVVGKGTAWLARLEVEGVLLDVLDDVFLLDLPLEATQRTLDGLAFLNLDFSHAPIHPLRSLAGSSS